MNYSYKGVLIAMCAMNTTAHTMDTYKKQEIVSVKRNRTFMEDVLDGAIAGSIEVLVDNPLSVMKNNLILSKNGSNSGKPALNLLKDNFNSFKNNLKNPQKIVQKYYKGCGTGVASMAPITALQNSMTFLLAQSFGNNPTLAQKTIAACGAGYLSALLASPADLVILQRQNPLYTCESLGGTLRRIYGVNGLRTMYRGLNGTGIRDGLFTAAYKTGGSVIHTIVPPITDNAEKNKILCASFAGLIAAIFSHPADVISARMKSDLSASYYKTTPQTAFTIVKEEGLAALFKGVTPRALRIMFAIPLMSAVLNYEPSSKIIEKIGS